MRKSIKKIAASLLAATMVIGSCVSVFASNPPTETFEGASTFSVAGSCFTDETMQWKPEIDETVMKEENGLYTFDCGKLPANADYQFKIVMDGADNAWAYQWLYGTQYYGDNCSQLHFGIDAEADVKITFEPKKAEVKVYADDKEVEVKVSVLSDERAFDGNATVSSDVAAKLAAVYLNSLTAPSEEVYSLVGAFSPVNWGAESEENIMTSYDANTGSYYLTVADVAAANDLEFKIVKDGPDNGWGYQLMYGTVCFGDNYTQFQFDLAEAGDVTVMYSPYTGEVKVLDANKAEIPFRAKLLTASDDDTNYTSFVSAEEAKAQGAAAFVTRNADDITDVANVKVSALDDVDTSVAYPVSDNPVEENPSEDPTTQKSEDPTTQAPTTQAPTTTANNQSTKTGDVAPVALMVVLFAAVAVVAVAAKKKEA